MRPVFGSQAADKTIPRQQIYPNVSECGKTFGGTVKDRKIEITVETCEVLLVRQRGTLNFGWCADCSKQVALISLSDACSSGLSAEEIHRQAEAGLLHLIEIIKGVPFICLNSLLQC
jgi:hypothetical protein